MAALSVHFDILNQLNRLFFDWERFKVPIYMMMMMMRKKHHVKPV